MSTIAGPPPGLSQALKWENSYIFGLLIFIAALVYYFLRDEKPYAGFPVYGKREGEVFHTKAKERFKDHGTAIMKRGLDEASTQHELCHAGMEVSDWLSRTTANLSKS